MSGLWKRGSQPWTWGPSNADYWEHAFLDDSNYYPIGCDAAGADTADVAELIWCNGFAPVPEDCVLQLGIVGPPIINGRTGLASGVNSGWNGPISALVRLRDVTNSVTLASGLCNPIEFSANIWPTFTRVVGVPFPAADARLRFELLSLYDGGASTPYRYGKIRIYALGVRAIR